MSRRREDARRSEPAERRYGKLDADKLFEQAMELIDKEGLLYCSDVYAYLGISHSAFYTHFPITGERYDIIKEKLDYNKAANRVKLRKMFMQERDSKNKIFLYNLCASAEEHRHLAGLRDPNSSMEAAPIIQRSKPSFWHYLNTCFHEWVNDRDFLGDVVADIVEFLNSDKKVLLVSMPQGAGKSYLANKLTEWLLGCSQMDKNTNSLSVMRICNTDSNVTKFQAGISSSLSSDEWRDVFGDHKLANDNKNGMRFDGSWNDNAFFASAKSSVMSRRADYLIFDDIYTDMAEAMSPSATNDYILKFQTMWRGRLKGSNVGKVLMFGTRYTKNDFYKQVLEMYPDSSEVVKLPAINEDGNSFCERTHPIKELLHDRETMNLDLFNAIYQQEPSAEGFINPFDGWEPVTAPIHASQFDYTCTVADPSFGVGGDFFVVGMFGYNRTGEVGLIDLLCERVCSDEMYIDFISRHGCSRNFIEKNGVGGMMIQRVCNRTDVPLFPFTSIGSKLERIYMNADAIKKIIFNETVIAPFNQLRDFGRDKNDDFPDMLSHFFNNIKIFGNQ